MQLLNFVDSLVCFAFSSWRKDEGIKTDKSRLG